MLVEETVMVESQGKGHEERNHGRPRRKRRGAALSQSLEPRLASYALAAGVAGAGILALPSTAKADIIYTPANTFAPFGATLSIDLNHDGISDFSLSGGGTFDCLQHGSGGTCVGWAQQSEGSVWGNHAGDGIIAAKSSYFEYSPVLASKIGPSANFQARGAMWFFRSWPSELEHHGLFWGGYLGLEFQVDSETYYGWALVSIDLQERGQGGGETLLGYAYDTVPNQSLEAGQTTNTPEPGTLGLLALGSLGLGLWRRRKAVASQQ